MATHIQFTNCSKSQHINHLTHYVLHQRQHAWFHCNHYYCKWSVLAENNSNFRCAPQWLLHFTQRLVTLQPEFFHLLEHSLGTALRKTHTSFFWTELFASKVLGHSSISPHPWIFHHDEPDLGNSLPWSRITRWSRLECNISRWLLYDKW